MNNTVKIVVLLIFILVSTNLKAQIRINEVCPMNYSTYINQDDSQSDWIELYNTSNEDINLSGWKINKKDDLASAYILPDTVIKSKSYMLLLCDDNLPLENPYKMIAGGTGIFKWKDEIGCSYIYKKVSGDFSFSVTVNNCSGDFDYRQNFGILIKKDLEKDSKYCYHTINNNKDLNYISVLHYDYPKEDMMDYWLITERYLDEYAIRMDKVGDSLYFYYRIKGHEWVCEYTYYNYWGDEPYLGLAGSSGNYYLDATFDFSEVKFNGESADLKEWSFIDYNSEDPGSYQAYRELFTDFDLKNADGTVYLYDDSDNLINSLSYSEMMTDISYGYNAANVLLYFQEPTPEKENGLASPAITEKPKLSTDENWFNEATYFQFNDTDAEIYYTLNGNNPNKEGIKYDGTPFLIEKSSPFRAMAYKDNNINSDILNQTIFIDEDKSSLNVISMIIDSLDYWKDEPAASLVGGNNWDKHGIEFAGSIEYFDTNEELLYNSNVDIKVHGNSTRSYPQKSHKITARSSLGNGKFEYPFFGDNYLKKFDKLILRNGGSDFTELLCRDIVSSALADEIGLFHSKGFPTTMYLNGEYWGKINLREKIDNDQIAEIYDIDERRINYFDIWEAKQGNAARFDSSIVLLEAIQNKNSQEFVDMFNLYFDKENCMDYFIFNTYVNNRDWIVNNVLAWNSIDYDNRTRFTVWDTDVAYIYYDEHLLSYIDTIQGKQYTYPRLIKQIYSNTELRNYMLNRFADLLNSTFLPENIISKFDSTMESFEVELPRHKTRWETSAIDWQNKLKEKHQFAEAQPDRLWEQWKEFFEIDNILNVKINTNIPNAIVKINTIDINSYPWTGKYFSGIEIEITAKESNENKFVAWSGDITSSEKTINITLTDEPLNLYATYNKSDDQGGIVINEIMYKAADDADCSDWIELYNTSDEDIDISNWTLTDDNVSHIYTLPDNIELKSKSYLVIVRNEDDFAAVYPNVQNYIGELDFGFGDEDAVKLYNDDNILIDIVEYTSVTPWYAECDGTGPSLECANPNKNNNAAYNWKQSQENYGTPGVQNSNFTDIEKPEETVLPIYPNPAEDILILHSDTIKYAQIYDLKGNLMIESTQKEIDISGLHIGSYFIVVFDGENTIKAKFIKQ